MLVKLYRIAKAQEVTSNKPSTNITLRVTTVLHGNERTAQQQ